MMSLCQRAGKMTTGEIVKELISKEKAHLVIIAENASDNTKKKIRNSCEYYNIPYVIRFTKEELSSAIGKYNRSVFAVTDKNFAEKLKTEMDLNM